MYVWCSKEGVWIASSEVKVYDIEENAFGEDVVSFECSCGNCHKSKVVSKYGYI